MITRLKKNALKKRRRRLPPSDYVSSSDSETETVINLPPKKRRKKVHEKLPTDFLDLDTPSDDEQTLLDSLDSLWEKHQNKIEQSNILRTIERSKAKSTDHRITKWARIFKKVHTLDNTEVDFYLSQLQFTQKKLKLAKETALESNDLKDKQKVLFKLIHEFIETLRLKLDNAKKFVGRVNTDLIDAIHPDAPRKDKRQFLKILVSTDKLTEAKKKEQVSKTLYGDWAGHSEAKKLKPATDFITFQFQKELKSKGFADVNDYNEAVAFMNEEEHNQGGPKLKEPKSHPKNMEQPDTTPNRKLGVPYIKLLGAKSKIEDIEKIFKGEYGAWPAYMADDLKLILRKGVPITQTQPLIPFAVETMLHMLEMLIGEAKIKLDLNINASSLTDDPKVRSQLSESIYYLRQTDDYKIKLLLNFIKAFLPENQTFKRGMQNKKSLESFTRKYPLTDVTLTKDKDLYKSATGRAPKAKNTSAEDLGNQILSRLVYESDGKSVLRTDLFFQKPEPRKN